MKELTVGEAPEGLSHPERVFADADEIRVVRPGRPVARILPVAPSKRPVRSLAAFRATLPYPDAPSEVLIRVDRDARG